MPLIKSASKKAVGQNIRTERKAGEPEKVAVAIALSTADRSRKHVVGHAAQTVGRSKKK